MTAAIKRHTRRRFHKLAGVKGIDLVMQKDTDGVSGVWIRVFRKVKMM